MCIRARGGGVGAAVGGGGGCRVGSGVSAAGGVGCEVGTGASPGGGGAIPLGVGAGGDDKGAGVAMPLGVGAGGDDKAAASGPLGPVSAVDRVNSTVATPGAGVAGAGVEGTRPGVGVSGVTPATGGTKSAGPDPWPDQVGAAKTNGERAMTTIKPMTVPTPVCVSFDGTATSPVTCDQSKPAGLFSAHSPQPGRCKGARKVRQGHWAPQSLGWGAILRDGSTRGSAIRRRVVANPELPAQRRQPLADHMWTCEEVAALLD
jgi:hypothetical protein